MSNEIKVGSRICTIKELFSEKYDIDFYQREYVWQRKNLEDLINDLSLEFLKNWKTNDSLQKVDQYDPYFMGEIIVSDKPGKKSTIIDGQQRITTFSLLLIYLWRKYKDLPSFPTEISTLIYSDFYGEKQFNLEIEERKPCMKSLFESGDYKIKDTDSISVKNLVDRYMDIADCWNDKIDKDNVVHFAYWLKEKVVFSRVWTDSDDFAYVIFETMNDRGVSLTQIEMLRSYILANIDEQVRDNSMKKFDNVIKRLVNIKLNTKSKAEFEFFKIYLRGHYAQNMSQSQNNESDFVKIGQNFHRWIRDNEQILGLNDSNSYVNFIEHISYYAKIYEKINAILQSVPRNSDEFLYLIVNNDYKFTMQPAVILAGIAYQDDDSIVNEKIKIISKYITKVLTWKVWNHYMISQSALESSIYELCKKIRDKTIPEINNILASEPIDLPSLDGSSPTVNQQNKPKIRVLLALITEIVARGSRESGYLLNQRDIEVEHIWANDYSAHINEFSNESEFITFRNNIGDLLLLPKTFNASYNDSPYTDKVKHYYSQNILAQTLNKQKYSNNPGFLKFRSDSKLTFEPYDNFTRKCISKRADLYREILKWNWK